MLASEYRCLAYKFPHNFGENPPNLADAGASVGDLGMVNNSDRYGTGEHLTAGKEPHIRVNAHIDVDRVVDADAAGVVPNDEEE